MAAITYEVEGADPINDRESILARCRQELDALLHDEEFKQELKQQNWNDKQIKSLTVEPDDTKQELEPTTLLIQIGIAVAVGLTSDAIKAGIKIVARRLQERFERTSGHQLTEKKKVD